ncbi:MAG: hypothetical protein AAGF12_32060 [Myxococcota bacterium]
MAIRYLSSAGLTACRRCGRHVAAGPAPTVCPFCQNPVRSGRGRSRLVAASLVMFATGCGSAEPVPAPDPVQVPVVSEAAPDEEPGAATEDTPGEEAADETAAAEETAAADQTVAAEETVAADDPVPEQAYGIPPETDPALDPN